MKGLVPGQGPAPTTPPERRCAPEGSIFTRGTPSPQERIAARMLADMHDGPELRDRLQQLAHIIVRCSIAAGGCDPDIANAGLTGPQVVQLGLDLAEHLESKMVKPDEPHPFTSEDPDASDCKVCGGGRMHYLHDEDRTEDDGHGVPQVRVGQVWAGITGNRMVVLEVKGSQCKLVYRPNPHKEEPIWEACHDVARNLDLVEDTP